MILLLDPDVLRIHHTSLIEIDRSMRKRKSSRLRLRVRVLAARVA